MCLSKNRLIFLTILFFSFLSNPLFSNGKADSKKLPELIKQTIENTEETTRSWSICKVSSKNFKELFISPLDTKEQAIAIFIYLELPEEKFGIAKNQTLYTDTPSTYFRKEYEQISAEFEAEGADNVLFRYFGMQAPEVLSPDAAAIFDDKTKNTTETENTEQSQNQNQTQEQNQTQSLSQTKVQNNDNTEIQSIEIPNSDDSGVYSNTTDFSDNIDVTGMAFDSDDDEPIDENQIKYAQNNVVLIETISQEELLRRKSEQEKKKNIESNKKPANQTYTLIESADPIPPNKVNESSSAEKNYSLSAGTQESESIARYQQEYLHDYETFGFPELPDDEAFVPQEKVENPNTTDQFGRTYLMKAAQAGNNWQIKTLLASGADINLTDNDGWTALMYAARYQENTAIIQTLLDAGADVRVMNNFDISALTLACAYNNNPDIINKLLSYYSMSEKEVMNAFIMLLTNNIADEYVQIAKIKIFLAKSIPLNTYSNGKTPLMYAAQFGTSTRVIQTLLDNNANISIRSTEGKTAFEYASKNKNLPHDETYWKLNKIMNKN